MTQPTDEHAPHGADHDDEDGYRGPASLRLAYCAVWTRGANSDWPGPRRRRYSISLNMRPPGGPEPDTDLRFRAGRKQSAQVLLTKRPRHRRGRREDSR